MTINCAERGLLLLRVRDEIRITIAAYQTLYESSVAFGMRKALASEQGKSDLERKVRPELSMGRVDPWVELGWVEIFQFLVGWVGLDPLQ